MSFRRVLIGCFISIILFPALGRSASAATLPSVTPDCDKTLYKVIQGGTACPDGDGLCVDPAEYSEATHGAIRGVMVNKDCGFDDFIQLFVDLANWGLAIMAVLALFFYIYGGFTMLISGGRHEYVENGKKILTGTTIGVIVMLTAWALVGFYTIATTGSTKGLVFPDIPEFRAPWSGKAEGCRQTYAQEHNQASCTQNSLHLYCADSADVNQGPVSQLQTLLNTYDCNAGSVDGCFGNQTETALATFERVNGLTENGVVEEGDWTRLLDSTNAVKCTETLGCCLDDVNGDGSLYICERQFPKTRCQNEGHLFVESNCPSYCSYDD